MLERGWWRRVLRRRSVQAGLALLVVPLAWGTYRLAVPHYQGRPITAYVRELGDEAVEAPQFLWRDHTKPVRADAFKVTGRVDLVVDALSDPDPRIRAGACRVLVASAEQPRHRADLERGYARMIQLLNDPSPQVQWHAASALGSRLIVSRAIADALIGAVQRADADGHLKAEAACSIISLTEDAESLAIAQRALAEAIDDPRSTAYGVFVAAFGSRAAGGEAAEALIRLLEAEPKRSSPLPVSMCRGAYLALLCGPNRTSVDVRVARVLLRHICDPTKDRADLAQGFLGHAVAPLARAVRAAVQQEATDGHDCPLRRLGRPCGRELWYVKRMIETGR